MTNLLKEMCWTNAAHIKDDIRAVVLNFHGLGTTFHQNYASAEELEIARLGGLILFPYCGPWSWMNRQSRDLTDRLVEEIWKEYDLDDSIPLISTGGSMGGAAAQLYCRYGSRPAAAGSFIYPVCDLPYHFTERPDLPTTFRHAYWGYPEPFDEVMREHSPYHQAGKMPDIPYLYIHGDADKSVNKAVHSDRMVARMRELGRKVEYLEIPGMGHGTDMPFEVPQSHIGFIKKFFK